MSEGNKKHGSEATPIELAVSRAVRDNLDRLQRSSDEVHEAIADVVAACGSTKPGNVLPPLLRAQAAAASLAASLEVLTRFISSALQPPNRTAIEEEILRVVGASAEEPAPAQQRPAAEEGSSSADAPSFSTPDAAVEESAESLIYPEPPVAEAGEFDLAQLPLEQQNLHRRANRVAKVSMQDIKMLHPEQVRQGREHKDICIRLRDDIDKAHKEYDRRFRPILYHPVDYFHHWMVEILAGGNPEALGEYPYSSPVRNR